MGVLTHRSYLENAYKALYSKRGVFPFSPLRTIRLLTDFLVGILLRSEFFCQKGCCTMKKCESPLSSIKS